MSGIAATYTGRFASTEYFRYCAAVFFLLMFASTAKAYIDADLHPQWLDVRINGETTSTPVLVLRDGSDRLWIRAADARNWRMRIDTQPTIEQDGDAFIRIDAGAHIDHATQTLDLTLPASDFDSYRENVRDDRRVTLSSAAAGVFLNYDLSAQQAGGVSRAGGVFELGGFNAAGVMTTDAILRASATAPGVIRLDTTWTQDHPDELATLRVGDATTVAPAWGRSVRFAGLQWATDFATQPSFVPFPLPSFSGEAVVPSTVDLYVNNALRLTRDVPAGPFTFVDVPVVSGTGQANVVVRDMLGREQAISLPYYSTPRLLQRGLDDVSYEAGFVRNQYGVDSFDYGSFIVSGTQRHGFSDIVTAGVHEEASRTRQTVGVDTTVLAAPVGVATASAATSHDRHGSGALLRLGLEHQGERISVGGDMQVATRNFAALGFTAHLPVPRWSAHAFATVTLDSGSSLGANVTSEQYGTGRSVRLAGLNYTRNIDRVGYFSASALRSADGHAGSVVMLSLTRTLGSDGSASVSALREQHPTQLLSEVQKNVPVGTGFGYRVDGVLGDSAHADASLTYQNDGGTYSVDATRSHNATAVRADASGSIAWVDGSFFTTRHLDDSFALVRVPGFPNVGISIDNQASATTDANGNALIPRLRAYDINYVSIDPASLPLDAAIDATEKNLVPAYRSAALAVFVVTQSRSGTATLVREDGSPIPAGARVVVNGIASELPVGLDGRLYLTHPSEQTHVDVHWGEHVCHVALHVPPTTEPQPRLGTFRCTESAK